MKIVLLAVLWMVWCAMHSFLIDPTVKTWVRVQLPQLLRAYRLLYNGLSLATLLPLVEYTRRSCGEVVFAWQGWGLPVRILLLVNAFLLFWGGAKRYDIRLFLGITQLRAGENQVLLSTAKDFLATGVFGMTRHPWYLGSLLALWSVFSEYSRPVLTATIILSLYLVLGTLLEERKIILEYGDSYRRYQQQVSMLLPWKWLKRRLKF